LFKRIDSEPFICKYHYICKYHILSNPKMYYILYVNNDIH
jgi:hypothetical protein